MAERKKLKPKAGKQSRPKLIDRELAETKRKLSPQEQEYLNQRLMETLKNDGETAEIKRLIDAGADIETENSDRWTPLIYAASRGYTETCKLLLDRLAEQGGNVSGYIEKPNRSGMTALMHAAGFGRAGRLCALLLDRLESAGGDVKRYITARDYDGNTALIEAAKRGHTKTCRLLLDRLRKTGGDARKYIDVRIRKGAYMGVNAFLMAEAYRNTEICALLMPYMMEGVLGREGSELFVSKFKGCIKG